MKNNKTDSFHIVNSFVKTVIPMVDEELKKWKYMALKAPDKVLSAQAVTSIDKKSFHAQGGSVYTLYPGVDILSLVKLITAYQTISDYLDNLCDRAGVEDENAFSTLHIAMIDALDTSTNSIHDYYKYYPYKNDGGYLRSLVYECKSQISKLPSYKLVEDHAIEFAKLYSCLQTYKHLTLSIREKRLLDWSNLHIDNYPEILPCEFWAATGSTLGIFILFAVSYLSNITTDEINKIKEAYFPWVCGLHILLDYFIDYNEDDQNGDLNFVSYYKDTNEILERLNMFVNISLKKVLSLKYPDFHTTVIYGLLTMYLSDNKAYEPNLCNITKSIISSYGIKLKFMHYLCSKLRHKGFI